MRLFFSIWLLILYTEETQAQNSHISTVEGTILDSLHRHVLPRATILLIREADSTKISSLVADQQGRFIFTKVMSGHYRLRVSYIGYQTSVKSLFVSPTTTLTSLETIGLSPQVQQLKEIIVRQPAPVLIRNDTVEYNGDSFDRQPNALLEDLLKKLPGIEVKGDGSVLSRGQSVQQVFVDGKPFFGNDPKMATQNLPASLIKAIQVFEKRSDQSIFSGVDDGNRIKTINILTKPEGRKGLFGQQVAGLGTDGHYQAGAGFNQFREGQQLSLLGQANNINQLGYSLPTVGNRAGAGNSQGQSGSITRSVGTGVNYSDHLGKRTEVLANYLFSNTMTQTEQIAQRQTMRPAGNNQSDSIDTPPTLFTHNQISTSNYVGYHSLNLRVNYQLDSMNIIQLIPSLIVSSNTISSQLSTQTQTRQELLNQSLINNTSSGTTINASNTIRWMHRFSRVGRTLSFDFKTSINRLDNTGSNQAQNTFYERFTRLDSLVKSSVNQHNSQATHSSTNELNLIYTEHLSPQQTIEFRYQLTILHNVSERLVRDNNQNTGLFDHPNVLLSNEYQSIFKTSRFGASWQVRQPKYTCTAGLDLQQTNLYSAYQTGIDPINRSYINLLPSVFIQPKLVQNHYLQCQYQARIAAPTINQLQPVANVTNPLYIQLGNPTLRPEYTHLLSLNYNSFQATTYRTIFTLLSIGMTSHHIVNAVKIDNAGVQTTQPINVDGYTTLTGSVSLGRPVKIGLLKSTLNLTTNLTLIRGISSVNEQTSHISSLMTSQIVRLNATLGDFTEVGLSATVNYQNASYSLQPSATNHSLNTMTSFQLNYLLPLGFKFATDISYTRTTGRSAGYNQTYTLWNGYISRAFFKTQLAELRFQVVDLLNQNRSLVRTVTDTYVEDIQSRVLKRYVLLSFIYNLRQFNGTKMP